jgi:capsular polysaccharide biosynthesis protein
MNATQHRTGSRIRLMPLLRRRWWLLALTTAAVALAAYAVTSIQKETYTSQALAVVPAGATSDAPGSATDAEQLAATYAALIPRDERIQAAVGREMRLPPKEVAKKVSVVNTSDTALLELRYQDASPERSVLGARALAAAVDHNTSPNIPRNTLNPVELPSEPLADTPGGDAAGVLAGLLLGLFLGGVLMVFLERADSRGDDDRDFEDATGLPATSLGRRSAGPQSALVERWESLSSSDPARVGFVPAVRGAEKAAERAADALGQAARMLDREIAIEPAAGPGREPSGESVGLSSDVVVLVARKGDPLRSAEKRLAELRSFGIEVERVLVVPRRLPAPDAPPPARRGEAVPAS